MRKVPGFFFATSGTYPWSFVTQIFHTGQPSHGGECKTLELIAIYLATLSHYVGFFLIQ